MKARATPFIFIDDSPTRGEEANNEAACRSPPGGYWAEVLSIPGRATQGDSIEELLKNIHGRKGGNIP